jgi:hypothetical protein
MMPVRSRRAPSFFPAYRKIPALLLSACPWPRHAAPYGSDEAEAVKDAVQNIFLAAESFCLRRTSTGRDAVISHRGTWNGENDETDLDQV